jgi:hypothetical protein
MAVLQAVWMYIRARFLLVFCSGKQDEWALRAV